MVMPLPAPLLSPYGMFNSVTTNITQFNTCNNIKRQALINFCGAPATQTNYICMQMGTDIGEESLNNITQFMDAAYRSGILVYPLISSLNFDLVNKQTWAQSNILSKIKWLNIKWINAPSFQFKGVIFDDGDGTSSQRAQDRYRGLSDLMNYTRNELSIRVGCLASYYLIDNDTSRSTKTLQGKTAPEGECLVDNSDFVVLRTSSDKDATDGPTQNDLIKSWYDYAKSKGKMMPLVEVRRNFNF